MCSYIMRDSIVYRANDRQAALLLGNRICDAVRSRSGTVCYLKMRRTPAAKGFLTTAGAADFTIRRVAVHGTDRTGVIFEHKPAGSGGKP